MELCYDGRSIIPSGAKKLTSCLRCNKAETGMVFQLGLVLPLAVIENIVLENVPARSTLIDENKVQERVLAPRRKVLNLE